MAKSKYVKVVVQSDVKVLSGYRVVGDFKENGSRVLMLERPVETSVKTPRKKKSIAFAAAPEEAR